MELLSRGEYYLLQEEERGREREEREPSLSGDGRDAASQGETVGVLSAEGSSIVQLVTVRPCSVTGGFSMNLLPATTASSPYLRDRYRRGGGWSDLRL
jgi:hypothetical protein